MLLQILDDLAGFVKPLHLAGGVGDPQAGDFGLPALRAQLVTIFPSGPTIGQLAPTIALSSS